MSKIYIKGQIGSTYNDDGTVLEKGVELQDVVEMFEPLKNEPNVEIYINSAGGNVNVGNKIHDYLSSFKNITTIADECCMSIATKIFLSAPIENRKIIQGCNFLVHCPLIPNLSGNSDDFLQASKDLKVYENDMVSMYVKKTGLSKEAVSGLMKQETSLTPEQAVSMGFAGEILPNFKFKAVAFFDNKKHNMKKTGFLASILALFSMDVNKDRVVEALILETDKGSLETPFSDLMVGDIALLDGMPAEAGTYTMPDGTIIAVSEGGVISAITNPSPAVDELMVEMKAELESLKTSLTEKDSMIAEMQAKIDENATVVASLEAEKTETAEIVAKYNALQQKQSNGKLIVSQVNFKKAGETVTSFKDEMKARKEQYKK
ncbi:MAG: hypothetical protein RLZ10_260 [Bacteroidota bacterium]|jgi:ATP-dependent protease ClpP protease subunit